MRGAIRVLKMRIIAFAVATLQPLRRNRRLRGARIR